MSSNMRPTDADAADSAPPPSKRQRCESCTCVPTVSTPDVTQPIMNRVLCQRAMTAAIVADDCGAFLDLLKEFYEWADPDSNYLHSLVMELCQFPERERFIALLIKDYPNRFTQEIWFMVAGIAPPVYMAVCLNALSQKDREIAYQKLSILGANPLCVQRSPYTREIIELIKKDEAKVRWLKLWGIQVEWP
jgi:hypothetical protein